MLLVTICLWNSSILLLKALCEIRMRNCDESNSNLYMFLMLNRASFLLYLIERAKKCLDFSATVYIIHLCICILYGGWPSSITWWVVNGTGLAIMALLGEYLCIKRELREIPISRLRSSKWISVSWVKIEKMPLYLSLSSFYYSMLVKCFFIGFVFTFLHVYCCLAGTQAISIVIPQSQKTHSHVPL